MRNNEISVSRNFSLPLSLVQEMEKVADEEGYYNRSDFARKAFRREIDFVKSAKEQATKEQTVSKPTGASQ